jgi:hypothetical protein
MPLYKCEYCNYSSKLKANYDRHEKSKKHRNKLIELGLLPKEQGVMNTNEHKKNTNEHKMNTNEHSIGTQMNTDEHKMNTKSHKCSFCENTFNTRASARRHEKHYCRENPDFVDKIIDAKNTKIKNLQKEKEKWEQERQELYKQVTTLLDKVGDTTNIQNNTIILNNYGSEDLSHITDTLKTELLNIPYCAIPKMIQAIHFNDEKPENKNIMLPNKKENLVKVYEGDKWVYKNKNDTITDLVDSKYTIIDDHYEELNSDNKVPGNMKTTFSKFRKFYDEGDAEMVDKLKKECELVLLNNR